MTDRTKHECTEENASMFLDWIANRGGVAVWSSVDLSDPGFSMSSPVNAKDGTPFQKPSHKLGSVPHVITDPAEIEVITRKEVKRFRVGVRRGGNGMMYNVTDGGTRRINAALAKAGEDSSYCFDYMTQEAVITVPHTKVLLSEWKHRE